ncbi:MAG TPA: hypothetical protein VMT86_08080 [Bryobacteraceae bacterium]|nr:hypothetical protein [Bryobacteraceae bacterium]
MHNLFKILLAVTPLVCCAYQGKAQAPPVPASYQPLYTQEVNYLNTFNATLNARGSGSAYPTVYAGTLTDADANAGPQLIGTNHLAVIATELQALKANGVKAVLIEVGFPMLYAPFLTSQGQSQSSFVSFYQQVAQMVRAQGLKLIVENNVLLSNDVQAGWNTAPFYQTLTWTAYQQARAQTAQTIAQTMQPDYLVVLEEPDTEAAMSGQANVNTPAGATAMLGQILAGLETARQSGMKVGAGVGTWLYAANSFVQHFVTQPMDYIDMHIYPINRSFLSTALTMAGTAAAAGMPVAMSECWLNKELDSEVGTVAVDTVRARNVFSFWEPLDVQFLGTMQALAKHTNMLYLTPSESQYFSAYMTYNSATSVLSTSQLISEETSASSQGVNSASYTSTASGFYGLIVPAGDTVPPSIPEGLSATPASATSFSLKWTASTDNVGVAGYYVLRNGILLGSTAQLSPSGGPPFTTVYYQDSGLMAGTSYSYTVEAFDLAGNVSVPSSSVWVMTPR